MDRSRQRMQALRRKGQLREDGEHIYLQLDPLRLLRGARSGANFDTTTKVIRPKKGKGSYDRRIAKRIDD